MALYAIGDLHLSFSSGKDMDVFGRNWANHEEKIRKNWNRLIGPEDTCVIMGDLSWAKKINDMSEDLAYVLSLPGRKILLRGNHDMFWEANKTPVLNRRFEGQLEFLQNNFYVYKSSVTGTEYALVGTKGYTYEGKDTIEHAEKLVKREYDRLKISYEAAAAAGYSRFLCFLHYPPTNIYQDDSLFTQLAEEYHTEQVIYAHCHGFMRFHDSYRGMHHHVRYSLASADCLNFRPMKVVD
jgi:predicted phosphohydrolase